MVPVFDPISGQCRLTDAIAALFELTPGERTQMDGHLARAKEEIDRMSVEHAMGASGEDGSWIINVPAFPERGGVVYEQMLASISAVLGPERTGSFLEIAGPAVERQLGAFGAEEAKIVLFPGTVSPSGEITYRVSESAKSWGTQGNSAGEFSQQDIETRYGAVARHHVPAKFWHP
jgi:hypothetical protein